MKNLDTTLAYLAGLIDGEAYIGIKKAKAYACQGRKTPGYHARIQIRMVHEGAIAFLSQAFGGSYYREKSHLAKGRPLFCYQASDAIAEDVLRQVRQFLIVKKESAESVIEFRAIQSEGPKHRTKITGYRNFPNSHGTVRRVANKSFSDEYVARLEVLYLRCKTLNHVGI